METQFIKLVPKLFINHHFIHLSHFDQKTSEIHRIMGIDYGSRKFID